MPHFLIILTNPPKYVKKDIDLGNITYDVYRICSIIRDSFCLSYSIRKNTILYLLFQQLSLIIKFEGNNLRFLGSDERSQAILLEKVLKKAFNFETTEWNESTPGIYYKYLSKELLYYNFIVENFYNFIFLVGSKDLNSYIKDLKIIDHISDYLFIIPENENLCEINKMYEELIKSKKKIDLVYLPKIKSIENKILYINFMIDQELR